MRTNPSTRNVRQRHGVRPAARMAAAGLAAVAVLLAAGCSDKPRWYGADGKPADEKPAVNISVTGPADGATDVPAAAEIAYTMDGASATVDLTDAGGEKVDGALRPDKSSWVPAKQLKWSTRYTAKITATSADGKTASKSVSFTTMAKPGSTAKASSVTGDGHVVGVAMPIIISFSSDIPKDQHANVQKRLFVTSEPAQEGIWYWWNSKEVHYRTKEYWQPGTKVSVRAAVGGLALGGNRFGSADLTLNYSIGPKIMMVADNATKQLTVTKDGQVLRTLPVSFGKPSSPTASGHFMIMIKSEWETFDSGSFGVPAESAGGYKMKVYWTQRLTWDGEYFHSAPWSVGDQGKRNVSHGCTNLSPADAEWLWKTTQVGDPVIIKGTEEHVAWQNGWTHWDRPWEEYVKGSAIPYTPPAPPSVGPSADPSATPSPAPS